MSNNPDAVRQFWRELGGDCVYKTFTAPSWRFSETRVLEADDLESLASLRFAPVIAQEWIKQGTDIRVTVIGEHVFAASVETRAPEATLDWRLDLAATWSKHDLPAEIQSTLKVLLQKLGLRYGCVDMRRRPDGTYVFFEVNPSGQFAFIEVETGQPLVAAMAELLLSLN